MTEKEKMLAGLLYKTCDDECFPEYMKASRLCKDFNNLYETDVDERSAILNDLLAEIGDRTFIRGPIFFDFGCFTKIGKRCFINFNFTVLDCNYVTIGNDCFFGPNVTIAPPKHPILADERRMRVNEIGEWYDNEYAEPVAIGNDCWIGAGVTVCGGVTIGDGCAIGAGSVVTQDIPSGYIAYGIPCKPIRKITPEDEIYSKKMVD